MCFSQARKLLAS